MNKIIVLLTIAVAISTLLASFFCLSGCLPFYKAMGMDANTAENQANADTKEIVTTIQSFRETFWPIVNGTIAGIGSLLTIILGKMLSAERKVSNTLAQGILSNEDIATANQVFLAANVSGSLQKLQKRFPEVVSLGITPSPTPTETKDANA